MNTSLVCVSSQTSRNICDGPSIHFLNMYPYVLHIYTGSKCAAAEALRGWFEKINYSDPVCIEYFVLIARHGVGQRVADNEQGLINRVD